MRARNTIRQRRPDISVVIPCRDEADNIPVLYRRLTDVLSVWAHDYEILFVDDGSTDTTAAQLHRLHATDAHVGVVHLSRGFGQQPALCAGLDRARGRAVILMDADLQDPPELIPDLIAAWQQGAEVVYAVRARRAEPLLLRWLYAAYYRLLGWLSDYPIPPDAGDFCLMDRRVVQALRNLPARSHFLRGVRAWVGFRQVGVPYTRPPRATGASKYSWSGLWRLAVAGLVVSTQAPMRWALRMIGAGWALTVLWLLHASGMRILPQPLLPLVPPALCLLHFSVLAILVACTSVIPAGAGKAAPYVVSRFLPPRRHKQVATGACHRQLSKESSS